MEIIPPKFVVSVARNENNRFQNMTHNTHQVNVTSLITTASDTLLYMLLYV